MRKMTKTAAKALAVGAAFSIVEPVLRERFSRSEPRDSLVWAPGSGEGVLLKNAEIVDVVGGVVLHRRGLLIRDGKIEDIATEKKLGAIEADKVIDLGGLYVIPGLINAHCHMTLPLILNFGPGVLAALGRQVERNCEECITHGVTTVRDAGSPPRLLRRYTERVEGGELLGPRVYSAGAFVNAPGGYPSDYLKIPSLVAERWGDFVMQPGNAREACEAVKRNVDQGSAFIKTAFDDRALFIGQKPLPILGDDSLKAVVKEAHAAGVEVSAHHRFRRGFQRAIDFELDGLEHCPADEVLTDREVEDFAAGGRFIVPTAQVGWALSGHSHGDPYLDDPLVRQSLANRLEVIKTVYPGFCEPEVHRCLMKFEKNYRDPSYVGRRHLLYTLDPAIFTKALIVGQENINKLYHAGVLMGAGNDGGVPQVAPGDVGRELVLLELTSEMKAIDVLRAGTINNARILGLEEELGSVEVGKLADLVLLSGNPLECMDHVLYPNAVFKEGKLLYTTHKIQI